MFPRTRPALPIAIALSVTALGVVIAVLLGLPDPAPPARSADSRPNLDSTPGSSAVAVPLIHERTSLLGEETSPVEPGEVVMPGAGEDTRVQVVAKIADPLGRFLDYDEVSYLLPNRDVFSSYVDFTPARGVCELRAFDRVRAKARTVEFGVVMRRDGSTILQFDLAADFTGDLLLVTRDREASIVPYRVGDPEPVFVVDLAALKAGLATVSIDLAGEAFARTPFLIRIERAGGGHDPYDGRSDSPDGDPLVFSDLPPGRYRVAAHASGCGIEPLEFDLEPGAHREILLTTTEEARVVVRVRYGAERRRAGGEAGKIRAPDALVGSRRVRLPMSQVVSEAVREPGDEAAESLSLRYVGLPPGPVSFLFGSDRLEVVLRPGDNGIVDFVLRDTISVSLEIRGVGDSRVGAIGGIAALANSDGVALVPWNVEFLFRSDGVATTTLDLVPGRYQAIFELENGSRCSGWFDAMVAGGTTLVVDEPSANRPNVIFPGRRP